MGQIKNKHIYILTVAKFVLITSYITTYVMIECSTGKQYVNFTNFKSLKSQQTIILNKASKVYYVAVMLKLGQKLFMQLNI